MRSRAPAVLNTGDPRGQSSTCSFVLFQLIFLVVCLMSSSTLTGAFLVPPSQGGCRGLFASRSCSSIGDFRDKSVLQRSFTSSEGVWGVTLNIGRRGPLSMRKRTSRCFLMKEQSEVATGDVEHNSKLPNKRRKRKKKKVRRSRGGDKQQTWRVFGVEVHPDLLGPVVNPVPSDRRRRADVGQEEADNIPVDKLYLTRPVLDALLTRLRIKTKEPVVPSVDEYETETATVALPKELADVRVVRRSLDARKKRRHGYGGVGGPRYTYVLDVDVDASTADRLRFKHQPGRMEKLVSTDAFEEEHSSFNYRSIEKASTHSGEEEDQESSKPRVIVVGAGPAGLFCALTLAQSGLCTPIVLERGQPVESRGKDIGALIHRRSIDSESNFAFGEGGAGTWSDGKLTTRIGRNSDAVRLVLETFVKYGAPEKILIDGAPHLGTDNLVRLLRKMRMDLRNAGGEIRFGAKVTRLHQTDGALWGVEVVYGRAMERFSDEKDKIVGDVHDGTETIMGDAVVLATGHSARDVYEELHLEGVKLEAKGFAAGFRVEHPQRIINQIQYGTEWGPNVITGRVATDLANQEQFMRTETHDGLSSSNQQKHSGRLPVASYRLATDKAFDGRSARGVYSFCMCPGGQIVPASTDPNEVCVNGMSFSKRDSLWANSALVVTISPDDEILEPYRAKYGVLAGIAFQRDMERRASIMGGGNLTVPVQRLTDFVEGRSSTSAPPSSYRLGIKPAPCHEIYPQPIVNALRDAVVNHFEKRMPGFLCEEALLHGVETRTSSPVRVSRDMHTLQAIGVRRLFPAGEGAGFAGGIVSAAVDGLMVADAVLDDLVGDKPKGKKKRSTSVGFDY